MSPSEKPLLLAMTEALLHMRDAWEARVAALEGSLGARLCALEADAVFVGRPVIERLDAHAKKASLERGRKVGRVEIAAELLEAGFASERSP